MPLQFTENAVATRAVPCERLRCGVIIPPGEPRIAKEDVTNHIKYVCGTCAKYYDEKEAAAKAEKFIHTGMRSAVITSRPQSLTPSLDFQTMRQNVNESQRQGAHATGGRVTAMPAPMVSHQRYPPISGYSASHAHHGQQTALWSERAYRGLNANQIGTLRINLYVYEPTFNAKGQPSIVDGIKEGLRVSSDITSKALCGLIRDTLHLPLLEYCGAVPFDINDMVVRDASNATWMRVDPHSDTSYFGDMFLKPHPRKKDGGLIFSIPANMKPPVFGLVFTASVWKKLEEIREAEMYNHRSHSPTPTAVLLAGLNLPFKRKAPELGGLTGPRTRRTRRQRSQSPQMTTHHRSQSPLMTTISRDGFQLVDETVDPETRIDNDEREGDSDIGLFDLNEGSIDQVSDNDNHEGVNDGGSVGGKESDGSEGIDEHGSVGGRESGSPVALKDREQFRSTTTIATRERMGNMNSSMKVVHAAAASTVTKVHKPLIPLDFQAIRQAFLEGGVKSTDRNSSLSSYVYEQINFHDLPQPTFTELIAVPTLLREAILGPEAEIFDAQLRYDPNPASYLGVGTFKTATRAHLTFKGVQFPHTGLGKIFRQSQKEKTSGRGIVVALKRPYREKRGGRRGVGRLSYPEEEVAVFEECKLLVWANSLLTATYDFMSDFMNDHPSKPAPKFKIPQFRFVAAGIAIAQKPLDNVGPSPTTNRAVYILEEILPGEKSDFVKYLHNKDATSQLALDDPDYKLVEFLMFTQHVQYTITGGVAYVSDFQGVGTCLTDPQIITSPQLGNDLFGDGNLGDAFDRFPIQHKCNKYCQWFEIDTPSNILKQVESATQRKKKAKGKGKKSIVSTEYNSN